MTVKISPRLYTGYIVSAIGRPILSAPAGMEYPTFAIHNRKGMPGMAPTIAANTECMAPSMVNNLITCPRVIPMAI